MEKEFVPYELALRLKAIGFDDPCLAIHSNANPKTGFYTLNKYRLTLIKQGSQKDKGVKAPLFQQAFKWFRENHNLNPSIMYNGIGQWDYDLNGDWSGRVWDSYEEAELTCLGKLIEIVESKSE